LRTCMVGGYLCATPEAQTGYLRARTTAQGLLIFDVCKFAWLAIHCSRGGAPCCYSVVM